MVPNFKIYVPQTGGRSDPQLFDLKLFYRRPISRQKRELVTRKYTAKAKKADRQYGNTPEGQIGRMKQKLLSFGRVRGLVVGA